MCEDEIVGDPARAQSPLAGDPGLPQSRDDKDCTPLHPAAAGGHVDLMRGLLDDRDSSDQRFHQ